MAQTGMETSEIVMGVVAETKPDLVIAVDALAARSHPKLRLQSRSFQDAVVLYNGSEIIRQVVFIIAQIFFHTLRINRNAQLCILFPANQSPLSRITDFLFACSGTEF